MTLTLPVCSDIELTGEAMEVIGDYYAELRSQADTNALPITVRTLETIIRLSTAAAKARLSTGVHSSHCLHNAFCPPSMWLSIHWPHHRKVSFSACTSSAVKLLTDSCLTF